MDASDLVESFGIVIYPPIKIRNKAMELSERLKTKDSLFVLGNKEHLPHITLYMSDFPSKNIPIIKKLLKQISCEIVPFALRATEHEETPDGYIFIKYEKSEKIRALQKHIIKLTNHLREGNIRKSENVQIEKKNKVARKNIELYGTGRVGNTFSPHLTLTKFKKFNKMPLTDLNISDFSFTVGQIALFYLGDYGTCRKKIEIFRLRK